MTTAIAPTSHTGQCQTTTCTIENRENLCRQLYSPLHTSSSLSIQNDHATVKDTEECWHLLSLWYPDLGAPFFIQLHCHEGSSTFLCDAAVDALPEEVGTPEEGGRGEERGGEGERRGEGRGEERRGEGEGREGERGEKCRGASTVNYDC